MPDISKIFIPKRISAVLRGIYSSPVTVVCAPDGAGKSTLLREYLKRSRPKNFSVRFITEADSTKSCFSQISALVTGKPHNQPITDSGFSRLMEVFSGAAPIKPLLIVIDCDYAAETLLGNYRTARLLSECRCAKFVFVCSSLRSSYRKLIQFMGFYSITAEQLSLTAEETAEYARFCGININIDDVFQTSRGSFLNTRLCFMLAQQGRDFTKLNSGSLLIMALLELQPPRMTGALSIASAFNDFSQAICSRLSSFSSITGFFGAELLDPDAIVTELFNLRGLIPLAEINLRRKTVKLHPLLRQALYTLFFKFPEVVRHDMRLLFGREYLHIGKNYYAFCEFFLAGEFELAAEVPYNAPTPYYMLNKSVQQLHKFVMECPLSCNKALPRLLRVTSLLMHTELRAVLKERFQEIIRHIGSSPALSGYERKTLLCYAYALRTNEAFFTLNKMGEHIKRAYELFSGERKYDAPLFPWGMYSPSVFFLLHRRGYSVRTETAQFTRYQQMYTEMLNHGRYNDIIFSGEAKYCQGDVSGALKLLSRVSSLCSGTGDIATRLCALYNSAKCCLYLGDHEHFFEYIGEIQRIERVNFSREEVDCSRLYLGLLRALRGGGTEDMWYAISSDEYEPLRNRFTAPYFALVTAIYKVRNERYGSLANSAPDYIETAKAAGNVGAEAVFLLLRAQALLSLGSHEKAEHYAEEAFKSVQENGIPSIAAELFVICPNLFVQIKPLLPRELHPVIDETVRLGKQFQRGAEVIRTYEMTYLSNTFQSLNGGHFLVPLKRLVSETESLRQQLGLTEKAYSYAILAASGVQNREISGLFKVSENSVKSSLKRTYAALGIKNRRGLIEIIPTLK